MKKEALFCDETVSYRRPSEARTGEVVHFFFRTAKDDADEVFLTVWEDGEILSERKMVKAETDEFFDYYEHTDTIGKDVFCYTFRVKSGEEECCYNRMGVTEEPLQAPFRLTPGFSVPDWCRGAVMYQIFTDRFCNGDPSNDVENGEYLYLHRKVEKAESWDMLPEAFDVQRFYGGDLAGVLQKLDYLKELGVEAIYLNPIFVSPSNHKYDCQDYEYVDPHLTVIVKDRDGLVPDGGASEPGSQQPLFRRLYREGPREGNPRHYRRRVQPLRFLQPLDGPGTYLRPPRRLSQRGLSGGGQPVPQLFPLFRPGRLAGK